MRKLEICKPLSELIGVVCDPSAFRGLLKVFMTSSAAQVHPCCSCKTPLLPLYNYWRLYFNCGFYCCHKRHINNPTSNPNIWFLFKKIDMQSPSKICLPSEDNPQGGDVDTRLHFSGFWYSCVRYSVVYELWDTKCLILKACWEIWTFWSTVFQICR